VQAASDYNAQERGTISAWKVEWDTKGTSRLAQVRAKVAKGEADMLAIKNVCMAEAKSVAAKGKADGLAAHNEEEKEHYAANTAVKLANMREALAADKRKALAATRDSNGP
jgi:hypothetical protein